MQGLLQPLITAKIARLEPKLSDNFFNLTIEKKNLVLFNSGNFCFLAIVFTSDVARGPVH